MELNIGSNIKRLRQEKGMTQERLAELLCVSTAAVSKWEAKNTYPDITMLFPLADIFGIRVDELLGYDEAKAQSDIRRALDEYYEHHVQGRLAEAEAVILNARKKYPHDYRVMNTYMWHKAGGHAGNSKEVLLDNREELTQICTCILEGCTIEPIRMEAITMKAKLLHAAGDTMGALELLSQIPSWGNSVEEKIERLYAKDTPEYRYYNRRNCYSLMDGMANKLARTVEFDPELTKEEKIQRLESMGDGFMSLSEQPALACLCVIAQMIYAVQRGMLTEDDSVEVVIHACEKQFAASKRMKELSEVDEILRDSLIDTYGTVDLVAWQVERLIKSPHPRLAGLRKHSSYMDMLKRYCSDC